MYAGCRSESTLKVAASAVNVPPSSWKGIADSMFVLAATTSVDLERYVAVWQVLAATTSVDLDDMLRCGKLKFQVAAGAGTSFRNAAGPSFSIRV